MPTRDRGVVFLASLGTVRETSSLWVLGGVDGTKTIEGSRTPFHVSELPPFACRPAPNSRVVKRG